MRNIIRPAIAAGFVNSNTVIIDSKSGTSGAGRAAKEGSLFCEVNEAFKAYGVAAVVVDERTNRLIAIAAIDNLVQGAAGRRCRTLISCPGSTRLAGCRPGRCFVKAELSCLLDRLLKTR